MASSFIFDRDTFVSTLDSECLGNQGRSAVILGGHKVGKSHLLEHICRRSERDAASLYCRINVDLLKAAQKLSDDVFLRAFLQTLLGQLQTGMAPQEPQAAQWSTDLEQAEQALTALQALPRNPSTIKYCDEQSKIVGELRAKLRGWTVLNKTAGDVDRLLQRKEPLEVSELSPMLTQLRDLEKRIVLIVDDYDQMLEEPFTDRLFSFLRGASDERKIIALVASRRRLMDVVPEPDPTDRKSLFNHFHSQRLVPFKRSEPEGFLDWLGRPPEDGGDGAVLDAQEKQYIRSLGGGCPHFLQYARRQYLQNGRPKLDSERRQFERENLVDEFRVVFDQVWRGSTSEEQAVLRTVAEGGDAEVGAADRLEVEGYLVESSPGKLGIFSTLFTDFIRKQPRSSPALFSSKTAPLAPISTPATRPRPDSPILVTPRISYDVFPSALFFACEDKAELATFKIENLSGSDQSVSVSAEFPKYSLESQIARSFSPGVHEVQLQVELNDNARQISNPVWTRAKYSVKLNPGSQEQILEINSTKKVRLLPRDHFLFARYDPLNDGLVDFTWLIAAWVNRNEPLLQDLRQGAAQLEPRLGYPVTAAADPVSHLRAQVSALYRALQKKELKYHNAPAVYHSEDNDYMQRVQTCGQSLTSKAANCLDGSVLFASLLSLCNIDPAIVLIPRHALVAWKNPPGASPEWQCVETTALATLAFEDACALGQKKLNDASTSAGGPPPYDAGLDDPDNFVAFIDVHRAFKERKLVPIE